MSTTQQTAERVALQGLLLLLVEVQSTLQAGRVDPEQLDLGKVNAFHELEKLVDSAHAGEMILLARAALATPATQPCDHMNCQVNVETSQVATCTRCGGNVEFPKLSAASAIEGPCHEPQPDKVVGLMCTRCCYTIREHTPRAIPAAAASTHE